MRIFITGGTGFIGYHLVSKLLKEGHDLLLLCRNKDKLNELGFKEGDNLRVIFGNLSRPEEIRKEIVDFCPETAYHLAWEGIPNYSYEQSKLNLVYGLNFFDLMMNCGCKKIIALGSCWEYGPSKGKVSEELLVEPQNSFIASKYSLLNMGNQLAKEKGFTFIWARVFFVYGPRQKETSLLPYLMNCIQNNEVPAIKNHLAQNDYIYIDDLIEALALLLNCSHGGIYNCGSGFPTSVQKIVKIIYGMFEKECPLHFESMPIPKITTPNFWADTSKINRTIGWKAQIPIQEGIRKFMDYKKIIPKIV